MTMPERNRQFRYDKVSAVNMQYHVAAPMSQLPFGIGMVVTYQWQERMLLTA